MRTRNLFLLPATTLAVMTTLAVLAQTTTVDPGSWNRYSSSSANASKLSGPHQTADDCTAAVPMPAVGAAAIVQDCRNARKVTKTSAAPVPAKPAAQTRLVNCPDGTKPGLWPQSAGYYSVPAPDYWALGSWQPAAPTATQCPPVVVVPPVTPPTEPPPVVPPVVPPAVSELPRVDTSAIPTGDRGEAQSLVSQTGEQPYRDPDGNGAFRTVCLFSHMGFNDPLVLPGKPDSSHLHTFFGNTLTDAFSTAASIAETGNSTCRGGTANRSSYWAPSVIDTATGRPIAPAFANVYYKATVDYLLFRDDANVKVLPVGLRMIAGNSKSRVPQSNSHYTCNGARSATLPNCPSGRLEHVIEFPYCHDGVSLDSPDHKSHLAFPVNGQCPSTHPVHVPQIGLLIQYDVPASGSATWRLSSDINGTPAGSSSHADWVNGWNPAVMASWVTLVINRGLSGGSHIIGGGNVIGYPR